MRQFVLALVSLALTSLGADSNTGPSKLTVVQRADLIELNHFYDNLGRHAFDQLIFWEWSPDYRRQNVIAWCMVENDLNRLPVRLPGGGYCARWYDRDTKSYREIRSAKYRETETQFDPERWNKKVFEEKYRVGFLKSQKRASQSETTYPRPPELHQHPQP